MGEQGWKATAWDDDCHPGTRYMLRPVPQPGPNAWWLIVESPDGTRPARATLEEVEAEHRLRPIEVDNVAALLVGYDAAQAAIRALIDGAEGLATRLALAEVLPGRDCGHDLEAFDEQAATIARIRAVRDMLRQSGGNLALGAVLGLLDGAIGDAPGPSGMDPAEHTAMERLVGDVAALTAERDELRAECRAYADAIVWDTTCLGCASVLTASHEQTVRAEKAEAERDRLRLIVETYDRVALENAAEADPPLLSALAAENVRLREERDRPAEAIRRVREIVDEMVSIAVCRHPVCREDRRLLMDALRDVGTGQLPDLGENGSNLGDAGARRRIDWRLSLKVEPDPDWACRKCDGPLAPCVTCGKPAQCGDSWCAGCTPADRCGDGQPPAPMPPKSSRPVKVRLVDWAGEPRDPHATGLIREDEAAPICPSCRRGEHTGCTWDEAIPPDRCTCPCPGWPPPPVPGIDETGEPDA